MSTKPARPPATAASVPRRARGLAAVAGAAGVLVALGALRLMWLSRGWPLAHDAPIMHYVAWRILDGATPYRDLFDMNFPGVYLAHLLLLVTLGPGEVAFRAFDLMMLLAIGAGLACALRGPGGLAAAALFALYHLAGGPWLAGQRDLMLCVCLAWGAAGILAALRAADPGRTRWLAVSALSLGAGAWIKPHAGAPALALVAWTWWVHRGPSRARAVVVVVAGVALPGLVTLAWLAWTGGLGAFADITLRYLIPLYSRVGRNDLLHEIAVRDYGQGVLVGLAAWSALGGVALVRGRRWQALGVLGGGLAYGAAHFWAQGRGWEYHFYPLALFATALGGAGLGAAVKDRRRALTFALVLALAGTAGPLWAKGRRNLDPEWIRTKLARVERLTDALRPLVAAGGTVQVLDTAEGGVHALLRARAREPSRFLYDFHFYHDVGHPYVRRLRAELMDALRARPPAAVALFEVGWPAGDYERLDGFPELRRWLLDGYRLAEEGDGYRLYVSRAPAR